MKAVFRGGGVGENRALCGLPYGAEAFSSFAAPFASVFLCLRPIALCAGVFSKTSRAAFQAFVGFCLPVESIA